MNKIWTITRKEVQQTFQDRSLLIIMFAAPLAVATIIAVTFGGISAGGAPIQDIPVAIVNLDEGGINVNNGEILTGILTGEMTSQDAVAGGTGADAAETDSSTVCPVDESDDTDSTGGATTAGSTSQETLTGSDTASSAITLETLLEPTVLDDPAAARAGVEDGTYAVAVIIPADFTANLTYSGPNQQITPTQIEVYGNPEAPISNEIVRGIVDGISTQLATVNIGLVATLNTVTDEYGMVSLTQVVTSPEFGTIIQCAVTNSTAPIGIDRQTVEGDEVTFNMLVIFGASQAIFFALFTAYGSATTLLEEQRTWTLQRMLVSPTTRTEILLGKMGGVFFNVLIQLVLLFIGFTVIGSLLSGEVQFIWGQNIVGIVLVVLAATLAVTGLGAIVAAVARTPEAAQTIGTVVSLTSALAGGAFGFTLPQPLPYLSVVYWGTDAFMELAMNQDGYVLGALVLAMFGVMTFSIALWLFDRRLSE